MGITRRHLLFASGMVALFQNACWPSAEARHRCRARWDSGSPDANSEGDAAPIVPVGHWPHPPAKAWSKIATGMTEQESLTFWANLSRDNRASRQRASNNSGW